MYLTENLESKWSPVLDHDGLTKIADPYRRAVTAVILENQEKAMAEESRTLREDYGSVPTNNGGGLGAGTSVGSYDPILISLVRRALPNLIAYDVCGVQPMTGPTGLIFAMRARYTAMGGQGQGTTNEALFFEANTAFSSQSNGNAFTDTTLGAAGSWANTDPVSGAALSANTAYGVGKGMTTAEAE